MSSVAASRDGNFAAVTDSMCIHIKTNAGCRGAILFVEIVGGSDAILLSARDSVKCFAVVPRLRGCWLVPGEGSVFSVCFVVHCWCFFTRHTNVAKTEHFNSDLLVKGDHCVEGYPGS